MAGISRDRQGDEGEGKENRYECIDKFSGMLRQDLWGAAL